MQLLRAVIGVRSARPDERELLRRALASWRGPLIPNGYPQRYRLEPRMFDSAQLAIGTKVEMEHTSSPALAMEIAMAHLYEMRDYYARLERMETGRMHGMRARPAAFVFIQRGCSHCHEYMPRFQRVSRGFPHPLGVYDLAEGGRGGELATRLGIQATPTTVVMDSSGHLHKRAGALSDSDLRALLGRAR